MVWSLLHDKVFMVWSGVLDGVDGILNGIGWYRMVSLAWCSVCMYCMVCIMYYCILYGMVLYLV